MPLAGGFVGADDPRLLQRFPLQLLQCRDCTLMQVSETVDPALIFPEYSYASSVNRTLVRHFEGIAEQIFEISGQDGLVVEFGCNDGVLLSPLVSLGARVVGVDPSDVARRSGDKHGWPLVPAYFGPAVAEDILKEFGPARVITANNVCAHVSDPNTLMEGVALLLADDGFFIFEVHYQGDLIKRTQFDTVYHEHTCYYSLTSIVQLLARHGLEVVDVRNIPIHSGSIHVTAARRNAVPASESVDRMIRSEQDWDISGFANRVAARKQTLHRLIADLVEGGHRVVAYGASGRATVLLNYCGLGPDLVEHVSDLSPLRIGKSVPGVGIPIVPRSVFRADPPDYAILTAWNYEPEIVADEQSYLEAGGCFIVPLPDIRVV